MIGRVGRAADDTPLVSLLTSTGNITGAGEHLPRQPLAGCTEGKISACKSISMPISCLAVGHPPRALPLNDLLRTALVDEHRR